MFCRPKTANTFFLGHGALWSGLLAACFLLLLGASVAAPAKATEAAEVVKVVLHQKNARLLLDADIDFTLKPELEEAAHKGVPLYFSADLQLDEPRWWWFDKSVLRAQLDLRIQYNALTRQWRVDPGDGGHLLPASNLAEALDLIRHIRDWDLAAASALPANRTLLGRLRLRLDISRLARPIQVDAFNSNTWSLLTPWKYFEFSNSDAARP